MVYKLYPIVDWSFIEQNKIEHSSIQSTIESCNFFQLRIKHKNPQEILEIIKKCNQYFPFAKFIINDYYQLLPYSNGLHLGIEDLISIEDKFDFNTLLPVAQNIEEWLSIPKSMIFGISTHNFHQFETLYKKYKEFLGYLAIGPCFETKTKMLNYSLINPKEILEILKFYKKEKLKISLVFIGGINKNNLKILHEWLKNESLNIENIYYASISSFLKKEIPEKLYFT